MADPAENAPMVVVDVTEAHETHIFRAIDTRENVMYILGGDGLLNARRKAHVLLREGYLVEDPIHKEERKWRL